jgi:hypothetical protein
VIANLFAQIAARMRIFGTPPVKVINASTKTKQKTLFLLCFLFFSSAYYTLVEIDNRGKLDKVQSLSRKMEEQLNRSKLHEGIFDLLADLRDAPDLSSNK